MSASLPTCPRCQTPAVAGQQFCTACGAALTSTPSPAAMSITLPDTASYDALRAGLPLLAFLGTLLPWITISMFGTHLHARPYHFGFGGWLLGLLPLAAAVVASRPFWGPPASTTPPWVGRLWRALAPFLLGVGVALMILISGFTVLGASFMHAGFGLVLFVLATAAWTVYTFLPHGTLPGAPS